MSTSSTRSAPASGAIVGVLAAAGIMVSLMQTLIVPLIPELPELLHTSASNASWAITSTLLVGAVATPVAGRLGDLYGKRLVLNISLVVMTVGSLVCALSDSVTPMVTGRALQGVSMGVIPLGISVMRDVLPPQKLGSAMAIMSSSLGIGGALGLPVAAIVAEKTDWHALFWASAVLGVVVLALILLIVPAAEVRGTGTFDAIGALVLSGGLACLMLAISKGGDWGWGSHTTLGLFGASVVLLLAWAAWELRRSSPLIDLRTSARRPVLMTNLASIVVGFAMYSSQLIIPQLLQLPKATGFGLGQSMLASGLWMAPSGLVMMIASSYAAKISAARGPKVSLLAGSLVIAVGYALALPLMKNVWGVLAFSCVVTVGVGFAFASMPALIMSSVPPTETAAANGLNSLMRAIGTSTSAAVVGVILAHMTVKVGPMALPSENGVRAVLLVSAGVAIVAALVVLAIPGRERPAAQPAVAPPLKADAARAN
ncbi:MFS transporter [Streptomyces sp. NPDC004042]|uniref:MFS transporter n=1 Tax=Streptomyces sp. NPDC004042 TaxID=3154451 RepID=UPI0033A93FC7